MMSEREEFLALREGKIGSSDIGTVVGLNPFCSPLKLWARMTGKLDAQEDNKFMFLGREMEPVVAKMFERETGATASKLGFTQFREDIPFGCSTPDYDYKLEGEFGILECKTTREFNRGIWEGGVPFSYHCQVIWQLGFAKLENARVACLVGGSDLFHHPIRFDEAIFNSLVDNAAKFIDCVKSDTPPEAGAHDKEIVDLLTKNATDENSIVTMDGSLELRALLAEYEDSKSLYKATSDSVKAMKDDVSRIENQIRMVIGSAAVVRCEEKIIKVSTIDNPGSVTKPYSYTRVMIKNVKEKKEK